MSDKISEIDKKLNAILGVEYNTEEPTSKSNEIVSIEEPNEIITLEQTDCNVNNESDKDFEFARENIIKLSNIGMDNIETLSTIAKDSQTPRMFEVLSGLIKNISDINSGLMDLHNKKISSVENSDDINQSNINVNQAIICTGTDMLKRLKERKNSK